MRQTKPVSCWLTLARQMPQLPKRQKRYLKHSLSDRRVVDTPRSAVAAAAAWRYFTAAFAASRNSINLSGWMAVRGI